MSFSLLVVSRRLPHKSTAGLASVFSESRAHLETFFSRSEPSRPPARLFLLLGLLGAYWNAVTYGFAYGKYNHEFDLALVNWLRDASLYPHDPIKEAFARFPTVFWLAVAYLSNWVSTERVLFVLFLLTKVVFFVALARLVARALEDNRLVACIVLSVALSPFLNDFTPFGASDILNAVQTHTSLAVALLLWVGVLLLEGRWTWAAVLCGLAAYLNALFVIYTGFTFLAFATLDWRLQKRRIVLASALGAAIALPWLMSTPGFLYTSFPEDYVEDLLVFYPFHLTLRSHAAYDLICGTGLVLATFLMVVVAAKTGLSRLRRLEVLTASYLIPVLLGGLFGEFLLTPTLARLQLLRADSFLVLYCILLIQIYGARLLLSAQTVRPGTILLLGGLAILLPLSDYLSLVWCLLIAMVLWADRKERFERFCQSMAGSRQIQAWGLFLLLGGTAFAALADVPWSSRPVIFFAVVGGYLVVYGRGSALMRARMSKLALIVAAAALLMVAVGKVPEPSSLWNFVVPPTRTEADWFGLQEWAKLNTSRDAEFLVPTSPFGFRVFSERSSWGEWKDGTAMYHFPPFAEEYRRRMKAVGFPWRPEWLGTEGMRENYKRLSWEHLRAVAQANHLSYIIQFREVSYSVSPIFANNTFAAYKVPQ